MEVFSRFILLTLLTGTMTGETLTEEQIKQDVLREQTDLLKAKINKLKNLVLYIYCIRNFILYSINE